MSLSSQSLGLLGTARSSLAWDLAAAATRLLRLSCREPPIHDADPSVQLAGDFVDRQAGGTQAAGLARCGLDSGRLDSERCKIWHPAAFPCEQRARFQRESRSG